ncbi:MFS transporter, partial [Candidatus Anaplasma sp. TIGMIC]|uniref:MFS transporter n=1 Tax=Candidatus Anaplasma sp. TIGMIC TaxID=3020713 RepID=UPI00232B8811
MKNIGVGRAVSSTIICNTLVWYDYVLFGSMAVTMGDLFFPLDDAYSSLLCSFCVFAVGFCMRPFGASVFGHIGDKYGRRAALVISIVAMSVPIGFMAVIPTYASAGITAQVLLVICRLAQGFSLGGETGNATFLIEHAKKNQAGLFGSLEVLSAVLGSVVALAVKMGAKYFTGDNFGVWGWRIPFIVGFIIGIISIYLRSTAGESPAYKEQASKEHGGVVDAPVRYLFKHCRRPLMLAISIGCVECCAFHVFTVFFISYISNFSLAVVINPHVSEMIGLVSVILSGGLTVAFGALSDVVGRKKVMGCASAA